MPWQKRAADLLTLSRLPLALALVIVGLANGRQGIAAALTLFLVAITVDSLDGYLARRSKSTRQTWIGEHDIECDLAFSVAILSYLALAKYVAPLVMALYLGAWFAVFYGQATISNTAAVLFQGPLYAGIVLAAVTTDGGLLLPVLVWVAIAALLGGQRFVSVRVPAFFDDLLDNVISLTRHRRNIP